MNSGHRDYPGSGHPEVNSPTSCFDCIISLSWWSFTTPLSLAWPTERCSSVAHSGWKKNRDQLPSILLSSGVLFQSESPSSPYGALQAPFKEGAKACRRSLALRPRWQQKTWWRRCRRLPDHRRRGTYLGRLARRALARAVWHAARLVRPFTFLCSEQAKYVLVSW